MDYAQAVEYLLSFADFERSGRFQERPDVAPMLSLLHRLGDPHRFDKLTAGLGRVTVHVAGSKGKGSICAMVESVLRAAGQRTGLYTSPHLHSYTERVRIDGRPIAEDGFARLAGQVRAAVEGAQEALGERRLVTFDLLTALGFLAFREAGVEVQVIEVGLGGRVDSTNVFETKEVAVIAPLSMEHTDILGDTLEQIAAEKAAIITPGCSAVMAPQAHAGAAAVVRAFAAAAGASVADVARDYRWRRLSHDLRGQNVRIEGPRGVIEARLPLLGAHQIENAATALAAVEALVGAGFKPAPTAAAVARGLAGVCWPGRLEVLREEPLIVADSAHNRDSARRLREALSEYFACERALFVVGASSDKDIEGLAGELSPAASRIVAVRSGHPRAMPPERIAAAFQEHGLRVDVADSVASAIDSAMAITGAGGVICLVGSLFVAAEGREHVLGRAGSDGH